MFDSGERDVSGSTLHHAGRMRGVQQGRDGGVSYFGFHFRARGARRSVKASYRRVPGHARRTAVRRM